MKIVKSTIVIIAPLILTFLLIYCYILKTNNEGIKKDIAVLKSQNHKEAELLKKEKEKLKDENKKLSDDLMVFKEMIEQLYKKINFYKISTPLYLQDAQKLYEQEKYLESMEILNNNNRKDGYKYYLTLLNEEKIGYKAKIELKYTPDDPSYPYFKYVQDNIYKYYYFEPSGSYHYRLSSIEDLLKKTLEISPEDKNLISKILFIRAEEIYFINGYEEDMDEEKQNIVISAYKKALEYADDGDKEIIKKKINGIEYYKN